MSIRAVFALLAALTAAAPVAATEPLSLVGTWSGPRERIARTGGYVAGMATLVITKQQGMTFTGYLARRHDRADEIQEELWGAFTPGGRLIAGADEEGVYSFSLVDADTLDYCYVESGTVARAVCARLTRQP